MKNCQKSKIINEESLLEIPIVVKIVQGKEICGINTILNIKGSYKMSVKSRVSLSVSNNC